ncbi:hypothetical protein BOTBODRAFT_178367 [Botryobasidium botryosum FD-172 SS1]|uniref:PEP5/VPS11 N-terminal domain-containing protein n=1 Tax=Botryobasidium botryosum (strain FD-172 SS1) TaxID=930990 RepID=A0A067M327_BOTB1|nr:hypothetical protein BOTBODRAFT_178367 [Botryobasidium botryosum FD-172 SS1]
MAVNKCTAAYALAAASAPSARHEYPPRPSTRDTRIEVISVSTHLRNPRISAMASTNTPLNAAPARRQFSFLDATPVRDVPRSWVLCSGIQEKSTLGTTSAGVLAADIHVLDREFIVHLGGRVSHLAEKRRVLVTLGEEAAQLPLLKTWVLEYNEKKTGLPLLLRSVKVQGGSRPRPVSTIALSHSLSHLALGLPDGAVLLYQYLDQSLLAGSNSLTSLPKLKIILDSAMEPITGLGSGKTLAVIDEVAAGLGCAAMDQRAREIIIGRDDTIYVCGPEGRGACFAIEWPKVSIRAYGVYLTVVLLPSLTSNSATVWNAIGCASNLMSSMSKIVTLLTSTCVAAKFIAYLEVFNEDVRDVQLRALFAVDSLYSYMIATACFTMHALFARGHGLHTHLD